MWTPIASKQEDGEWLGLRRCVVITNVCLAVGIGIALFATLWANYDWDIDHEIYFGQQLGSGDPIWVSEFHDKTPLVQQLFALPGLTKSVHLWQVMSAIIVGLGVLATRKILPQLSEFRSLEPKLRHSIAWAGGLLFAFSVVTLPGGITVINGPATSMWLVSVLTLLLWVDVFLSAGTKGPHVALLASIAGAVAVSIRPYLAAPLAVMVVYALAFRAGPRRGRRVTASAAFAAAFAGSLLVLNLIPYVATSQLAVVADGLRMLAADLNPTPATRSMIADFTRVGAIQSAYLWLLLVTGVLCMVRMVKDRTTGYEASVALASANLALLVLILRSHWWSHYVIMFSGPVALLVVWGGLGFIASQTPSRTVIMMTRLIIPSVVLGLVFSVAFVTARPIRDRLIAQDWSLILEHPDAEQLRILQANLKAGESFLVPHSMYVHWVMTESRHGFPHASNTDHVLKGWWTGLPNADSFSTPRDEYEYCNLLRTTGPSVVAIRDDSALAACLTTTRTPYELRKATPLRHGSDLLIFERSRQYD